MITNTVSIRAEQIILNILPEYAISMVSIISPKGFILILATVFWLAPSVLAETQFIDEVVNLPFTYNVLPQTYAKKLKQIDLRSLATSLVERKRRFQQRWSPASQANSSCWQKNIELISFFPEQYIEALFAKGQLNIHQTKQARGFYEPVVRALAEDYMIGIHLENVYQPKPASLTHYLRPKYGFVNFLCPCPIFVNPNRFLRYGKVVIVYRDEVKMRSTYSFGDSLASYCEPTARSPIEPKALLDFTMSDKDNKHVRYVEAQIWGPVDLTDIKEFRIPKERADLLDRLKAGGLPVYSYAREEMERQDCYVEASCVGISRGDSLWDGSSK